MPFNAKSLVSLRSWLFYAEVVAVIGFVGLAFFYIRRGTAESESPPLSQVGAFIQQADTLYKKQDLADAALYYWQALQALETQDNSPRDSDKRHLTDKGGSAFARQSPHCGDLFTE